MIQSSGSITIIDVEDSVTYVFYAKDDKGTESSVDPSPDKKYIGFYNGPSISGGPPTTTEEINKIILKWQKYTGENGKNGEDGITPIQLVISSQDGEVFINGVPNITLEARVFHNGVDITGNYDASVFHWYKIKDVDETGQQIKEEIKTGKTLPISSQSIVDRASFMCTLIIPNDDERLKQLPLWNGGNF